MEFDDFDEKFIFFEKKNLKNFHFKFSLKIIFKFLRISPKTKRKISIRKINYLRS